MPFSSIQYLHDRIFLLWKTFPQRGKGGQLCGFFYSMASIRSGRCYILQIFGPKERWIEPIILHKMATNKKCWKARPTTTWIYVLIFKADCILFRKGRGCDISFESTHRVSGHAIGENKCWLLIFGAGSGLGSPFLKCVVSISGSAQIALEPPLCQTGKPGEKSVPNHPGKPLYPPLSGNAHIETTHFKKGLPSFEKMRADGNFGFCTAYAAPTRGYTGKRCSYEEERALVCWWLPKITFSSTEELITTYNIPHIHKTNVSFYKNSKTWWYCK